MRVSPDTTTIGFIGLGVMGKSMAGHLLDAGYRLNVYTRTKNKADDLLEKGACWCDNAAGVAQGSDVIITIVGFPADVEECYFGETGILSGAREAQPAPTVG